MGEIADWYVDREIESGCNLGREDEEDNWEYVAHKTCKNCGTSGLRWAKTLQGGWKLVDAGGNIHFCPTKGVGLKGMFKKQQEESYDYWEDDIPW